jgi:hypothetical protein
VLSHKATKVTVASSRLRLKPHRPRREPRSHLVGAAEPKPIESVTDRAFTDRLPGGVFRRL